MRIVKEIIVSIADGTSRGQMYRVVADIEFESITVGTGDPSGIDAGRAVDEALLALKTSLQDHSVMP